MKIQGVEIERGVIDACVARMKERKFKASEISGIVYALIRSDIVTRARVADRVADALIQKHRKAGHLEMQYPHWTWRL